MPAFEIDAEALAELVLLQHDAVIAVKGEIVQDDAVRRLSVMVFSLRFRAAP